MSAWETNNQRYLSATLAWLRLRLERLAESYQPAGCSAEFDPIHDGLEIRPTSEAGVDGHPGETRLGEPPAWVETDDREYPESQDKDALLQAEAELQQAEAADPPPAMVVLSERFGLSQFEQRVLLLSAAVELDTRVGALCARAQDDPNLAYPTFALALALFDDAAWDALSPHRPLRYWRLIEIHQPGNTPLINSSLGADERVASYLKGINYLDDRLLPLVAPLDEFGRDIPLSPSQQKCSASILDRIASASEIDEGNVVQLVGPDASSMQHLALHLADALGVRFYTLSAEQLPPQTGELETLARLWQRECVLLPIALYLDAHDAQVPAAANSQPSLLNRFLARTGGFILVDTREAIQGAGPSDATIDIAKPTPDEQREIWSDAFSNSAASQLSTQFDLSATAIHRIARSARIDATSNENEVAAQLWDACLAATRPRLDQLAQRIDAKATWDDIVLPASELTLLRQIAAQVRHRSAVYHDWGFRAKMNRGLGITALFAGESGTGKTMAAEVIANDLRLNLYRIDLSAVISKYIGETEKNLRRVFDAAENGGAILFFDEADALFGKRSEVKDSHDRYANIEINYLLQRMEAYRGLAILATNMKSAMDQAFVRRLRFIVNFTFPSVDQRRGIWQKTFPAATPTDDLDYNRLAKFHLTGGSIHNIGLASAFLAADAGTSITMPTVFDATRTELRKLERPIQESEFRWQSCNGGSSANR